MHKQFSWIVTQGGLTAVKGEVWVDGSYELPSSVFFLFTLSAFFLQAVLQYRPKL